MQVSLKSGLIVAGVILLCFVGFAAYHTITKNAYDARIVELQNQVAAKDQTIEVQKGVYEKLTIQTKSLESLLGSKDQELKSLKDQLDKQGAQLLTATSLVVKLRHDLETHSTPTPTVPVPDKPDTQRVMVDSKDDFDPFRVFGQIDVDCKYQTATIGLKLRQLKPLNISVVVSQDKEGTWRSTATSSVANFQVDIALAAVNPYLLEPKWYEKIGLGVDLGVGTNPGLLAGIGVYYTIGKFELGPRAWVVVDHGVSPYFGAQLLWHPFQH